MLNILHEAVAVIEAVNTNGALCSLDVDDELFIRAFTLTVKRHIKNLKR